MTMNVTCGSVRIEFENTTDWYPLNIFYASSGINVTSSSVNGGPVVNISGANPLSGDFIGGQHGASTVLNKQLIVDGIPQPFVNGSTFSGRQATLSRTLKYHDFFQVEHVLSMKNNVIDENFVVRSLTNSSSGVDIFYGCLNARQNRFTDVYHYNKAGQLLNSGVMNSNDNGFSSLRANVYEVRMVDPTPSGCTIIQRLRFNDDNPDCRVTINDRTTDNKIYWRFIGYETSQNNKTYSWSSRTSFQ